MSHFSVAQPSPTAGSGADFRLELVENRGRRGGDADSKLDGLDVQFDAEPKEWTARLLPASQCDDLKQVNRVLGEPERELGRRRAPTSDRRPGEELAPVVQLCLGAFG